ncbi:hypothetical protein QQP08_021607 [Theobroma cacao]|nr:hypothetical protein QQP08_021607 [Theobroma cacao]
MNLKGCKAKYLQNYSHMAYTSSDNRGRGSVWALWFHHLIDYRQFQSKGQDLFVKSWLYGTEYAIDGLLSVKSDLFSFVGRKYRELYHPTQSSNLVEHRQYKMTALKLHKN